MTFSILAQDSGTGAIGGAAATGSLCVGGWVLRGDLEAGLSASQGAAPSVFWGEDVLTAMRGGMSSADAVQGVTAPDTGRAYRQLTALDRSGTGAAFTGSENQDVKGSLSFPGGIVAGNMLGSDQVLPAMAEAFATSTASFEDRLLLSLCAARDSGGDFRGLLSAALLVLHPDQPPLTLRIDHCDTDPIAALQKLHLRARSGDYAAWTRQVPVASDKARVLD